MNASPRPLVAVVFDLDGVIVDTARLHYAAWKRLADSLVFALRRGTQPGPEGN